MPVQVVAVDRLPAQFAVDQGDFLHRIEGGTKLFGAELRSAELEEHLPHVGEQIAAEPALGVGRLLALQIGQRRSLAALRPVPAGELRDLKQHEPSIFDSVEQVGR